MAIDSEFLINRAYVLAKDKGILVWGASPEWAFVMGYLEGIEFINVSKTQKLKEIEDEQCIH